MHCIIHGECGFNGKGGGGFEIDDKGVRGIFERKRAGGKPKKIKGDEIWKETGVDSYVLWGGNLGLEKVGKSGGVAGEVWEVGVGSGGMDAGLYG